MGAEPITMICNGCGRIKDPLLHSCPSHTNPSYTPFEHPNRDRSQSGVNARSSREAAREAAARPLPTVDMFVLSRPTRVVFIVACPQCGEAVETPAVLLTPQLAVTHAPAGRLGVASSEFPIVEHICGRRDAV